MTTAQKSDEILMLEVAKGTRQSLEVLIRRYASSLLTFIQRMIGDEHRSEELFQEVFMRVWIKRRQFKSTSRFRPWLYTIAVNYCRADFRGKWSPPISFEENPSIVPVASDPEPVEVAIAHETSIQILRAVGRLPDQQRTVAVLRIFNNMSYTEIGKIVEREKVTVRSYMHRALSAMRNYLEPRLK